VFLHQADILLAPSRQMNAVRFLMGWGTIMSSFLKFKLPLAILIVCTAVYVVYLEVEASGDTDEQVSESAVWSPSRDDLAQINHSCNANAPGYAQCFIKQMSELGATDDSISFTRQYAEQNNGVVAVLEDFRPVDSVDLGYAYFPAASEAKHGWLLVNGIPSITNVDNPDLLPESQMEKDPEYLALRQNHPKAGIIFDAAERASGTLPEMMTLSDSNQRFVVPYSIRNGCRDCPLLGHAYFSFDFDPTGQLMGVKYQKFSTQPAN
jgi:hypothetical protein